MGELFAEIGDLVFSIVIGYISAIEFLYVVRHLYHYSCNHDANEGNSNENLSQLQDSMRQQLINAKNKEASAGTQVMKDGVAYKDGFRLEAQQSIIDQLKDQLTNKELTDLRRQELEKELVKQTKIAEKLRKELAEAEAKYQRQVTQEEEAKAKKILEEQKKEERAKKEVEEQARRLEEQKKREAEERIKKEVEQKDKERKISEEKELRKAVEQAHKLAEAEKQREAEQRQREEDEENVRRLQEVEKQKEKEQQQLEERERVENIKAEELKQRELAEAEANGRRLFEKEKANEEKLAAEEAAADLAAKKLLTIEHQLEEQLRAAEREAELTAKERQLIDSIKRRDVNDDETNEHKEAELLRKILEAREQLGEESEEEQSIRLLERERDQEAKQKRIEENALLFLEAEKEMADLQTKMLDAVDRKVYRTSLDSAPQTPIVEEPCIKRNFSPLSGEESSHSTVKTQLAQDFDELYSVRTKPYLLFPGVSDDTSSIDPASSQKSSFSTQPSEEITTGTDSQYPALERQEPDGEDNNLIHQQYSDDYLRSLDGIKQRPLVREDGSGRRRAFKKRRSSNSSNSSRESRQSRDEELKMFTSLEEEEMKDTADSEFTPIRYSTEPTLKVKGHHRRHKRSPAKDMRRGDDSLRSSLERLGEETSDPWGEARPEQYKHTEFWKREKTLSIDEETEFEKPTSSEEMAYNTATNLPSASSFEEATQKQNQEALSALQKHSAQRSAQEAKSHEENILEESARSENTKNLQTSKNTDGHTVSGHSLASSQLRLSSRKEEVTKSASSTVQNTPIINVQTPLDYGPWRDEYGLVMEGLSDFYDFTASVNPSRSRSASRNVSPANTAPNTPLPKDVSFQLKLANEKIDENATIEIYDDVENSTMNEFQKENIIRFIDSLSGKEGHAENENRENKTFETEVEIRKHLKKVADDPTAITNQASLVPLVNIIEEGASEQLLNLEINESSEMSMNTLVSSLRSEQSQRSRSRSKSPLPTSANLKRSVENRRYKMIKHNEDILEKLIESKLLPELTPPEEDEKKNYSQNQKPDINAADNEISSQEESSSLVQSLQVDRRRSRSKSPMRLPTPENLSKGLEKRRSMLIERNDELIKQLEERSQTPESLTIVVEHIYDIESSQDIRIFEETETTFSCNEEENCRKEEMDLLVQSLRVARSKTKSKSPFDIQKVENTNETKTYYDIHNVEYMETTQYVGATNIPTISIDLPAVDKTKETFTELEETEDCSRDKMKLLVQSLRAARSKSMSRTPTRLSDSTLIQQMVERAKTPEPSAELVSERSRHSRSRSPSRSHSTSPEQIKLYRSSTPSRSPSSQSDGYSESHLMLNKTLTIGAKKQESCLLISQQKQLDEEALEKLRNASEEMELRSLSPLRIERDEFNEEQSQDYLTDLPLKERAKFLKKSPTTPDYDRTVSEEVRDNERIKQQMLTKGFKRSTYVGESMDLGSEFEPLRKEAAKFQRSRSPSPSFSTIENATAQRNAEENRKIQDLILQELTTGPAVERKEHKSTGAIPKTEHFSSCELEQSPNSEIDERFSTNTDNFNENFEEMRRRNAEFRRSASASRSPLRKAQKEELAGIELEVAKRVLKDKLLDEVSCSSFKFQDISHNLNQEFFSNDRRASDSALMKVPEILLQLKDDEDMEPEEYHHYRRYSLAQEEPQEQYPSDDYIFIQQVEVRTRSGSRTWLREDFYSENVEDYLTRDEKSPRNSTERENIENPANKGEQGGENSIDEVAVDEDDDYSNASDDDRQTVVEVDDEIDEDISDFNERGPAEESHHEISECEEAEREIDRYAGREASDWNPVVDVENRSNQTPNIEEDEGAVGGFSSSPYDSDSFAIDEIYDEAIKNRKQSGILREYDNILRQMSSSSDIDEQYLLWSKTNSKKIPKNIEFNTKFLESERKESEMRYLGDANSTARQSTRLHSRYGYKPILQTKSLEDELEVDLSYKPKKEYNWRKNFKLDDDAVKEDSEISLEEFYSQKEKYEMDIEIEKEWEETNDNDELDQAVILELSSIEESDTFINRSPEQNMNLVEDIGEDIDLKNKISVKEETKEEIYDNCEKPKKKKTKKKSHKESKASLEETMNREDEEAYDNQVFSRRSSSIQMDTDSPKRKSRSRRSSKSSLTNEDHQGLFSPRNSVAGNDNIEDIMEEYTEVIKETARPKKMKKRKKVKEVMANLSENSIDNRDQIQLYLEALNDISPVSAVITPESSSANILSILSPQNSVCITPASIESDINLSIEELRETDTNSSTTTTTTTDTSPSFNLSRTSSITTTTPMDSFDILKDANFYPLF